MRHSKEKPRRDTLSTWEELILRWDAAYTSYRTALQALGTVGDDELAAKECREAEAAALAELTKTRAEIDSLIAKSRALRPPLTGTLKVATIVHGDVSTSSLRAGRKRTPSKRAP